jgi:hypothetical protein
MDIVGEFYMSFAVGFNELLKVFKWQVSWEI